MSSKIRLAALAASFIFLFAASSALAASANSFRVGSQEYSFTPPAGFVEVTSEENSELYAEFMEAVRDIMPNELYITRYFISEEDHRLMLESGEAPMSEVISIIVLTNLPDQPFSRREFRQISAYLTPDRIEQHAAENTERVTKKISEDYDYNLGMSLTASPTILADTDSLFSIGISMLMQDEGEEIEVAEITSVLYLGGRVFMVQQCRDIYDPADMAEFTAGYRATLEALNFQPLHASGLPDGGSEAGLTDGPDEGSGLSAGLIVGGVLIFLVLLGLFIVVVRRILRPRDQAPRP